MPSGGQVFVYTSTNIRVPAVVFELEMAAAPAEETPELMVSFERRQWQKFETLQVRVPGSFSPLL